MGRSGRRRARPAPLVVRSLSAISARAMGIRAGGALLVRPDGTPAGWWAGGEAAGPALRSALSGVAALQEHRDALAAADAERDEPELVV